MVHIRLLPNLRATDSHDMWDVFHMATNYKERQVNSTCGRGSTEQRRQETKHKSGPAVRAYSRLHSVGTSIITYSIWSHIPNVAISANSRMFLFNPRLYQSLIGCERENVAITPCT